MNYPRREPNPELESELKIVAAAPKSVLRKRYQELFHRAPPKAFGPDLLRRSVAHRLQENAHGGLPKATQRELKRLVRLMIEKPGAKFTVARRAQSGTVLVRDWKGKRHQVMIQEQGFSYAGRDFTNLSEIARLITGTRWNGPRFFGLRRQQADTGDGEAQAKPLRSARPKVDQSALKSSRPKRMAIGHGL
ncbi:DUF2924 domain-containing protein [Afipia broomeae]|uniref:DUF2924 domain-containing protein n=1 Tax=Afipia broomeae ATCC 49717 TaxID=883078 RepID=K8PSW8_9BRAD|nr:DUF2924 domain-containing protein [Afipia broomeae]EKS41463.1 hypothetical protein HMPREF9695_00555 [Afipia broomeae ATCC 49717]